MSAGRSISVLYAIGTKLGGSSIGAHAHESVRGLLRHGQLRRVLCGAYDLRGIPPAFVRTIGLPDRVLRKLAVYDRTRRIAHLQKVLFDHWATARLEVADVYFVWYNCALRSIPRAKAMGMVTVLQWGSFHPQHQRRILGEEHARWGIPYVRTDAELQRALREAELADYVICETDAAFASCRTEGMPPEKLLTLPNGVDLQRFRPVETPSTHAFRALYVGQISLRKGVPYLLEAWRTLAWHDAELWLAGNVDAEIRPLLARYAGLPGLRFVPYTANPVALYQAADVFVFPSLVEGGAKVGFEALACGLPVVTTHTAGSVARDGVEGLVVPSRDAAALARAMKRLRADGVLRQQMGLAARARAALFSWERHGDRLADALQGAVDRRRGHELVLEDGAWRRRASSS
ncbi:MAG: glycosyltransferase family 4 protein [Candidatus Binatia bacterium]